MAQCGLAAKIESFQVPRRATIPLNAESCISQWSVLPDALRLPARDFAALWAARPTEYGTVRMRGLPVRTPRYQQAYGSSYYFTGELHVAQPLSTHPFLVLVAYWIWVYTGRPFTQALINWYDLPTHRIGWHSDEEKDLTSSDRDPEAAIYSLSYGAERPFDIRFKNKAGNAGKRMKLDKGDGELDAVGAAANRAADRAARNHLACTRHEQLTEAKAQHRREVKAGKWPGEGMPQYTVTKSGQLRIPMRNETCLVMRGKTQRDTQHQVGKWTKKQLAEVGRDGVPAKAGDPALQRINLTFRLYDTFHRVYVYLARQMVGSALDNACKLLNSTQVRGSTRPLFVGALVLDFFLGPVFM